jgi:hypothetical protein
MADNSRLGPKRGGLPPEGYDWGCVSCQDRRFRRTSDFAQHAMKTHGVSTWQVMIVEVERQ